MSLYSACLRVLVVEDSQPQLKLIDKVLSKIGDIKTQLCTDAFEAYATLRASNGVDLVILDHKMPYTDGLALLSKLRSLPEYQDLPIVMSTAEDRAEDYRKAGASEVLIKPYDIAQLKQIVETLTKAS